MDERSLKVQNTKKSLKRRKVADDDDGVVAGIHTLFQILKRRK